MSTMPFINNKEQNEVTKLLGDVLEQSSTSSGGGYAIEENQYGSVRASSACQRIPHHIRNVEPSAFDPHLVSFGPYRHGKLQSIIKTERLKVEGFRRFLKRCNHSDKPAEAIAGVVCMILESLKEFYPHLNRDKWGDDALFLKLMAVDGCFMLEVLLSDEDDRQWLRNDVETIKRDMLLLENQLPMSLLGALLAFMMPTSHSDASSQTTPIYQVLNSLVGNFLSLSGDLNKGYYVHILDMYRAHRLHALTRQRDLHEVISFEYDRDDADWHNSMATTRPMILPASKLEKVGITFEKSTTSSLLDVSFDSKRGMLRIPELKVDDVTKSALFNVIAFERVYPDIGNEVTCFVTLMDDLIDGKEDVWPLTKNKDKKILENGLGTDEAAAEFFNVLGKGAGLSRSNGDYFDPVYKSIHNYCSKPWNEWWTSLVNTKFQSPWTIISLIAGLLGGVLLFLGTFYQVYGYHHPPPRG